MSTNVKLNTKQKFRSIAVLYGYSEDSSFIEINDSSNYLKIKKEFHAEDDTKIINEWGFSSGKFYTCGLLSNVFTEEIVKTRFFFNFPKNFRGCLILLSQLSDTFSCTSNPMHIFAAGCVEEIFNETFGLNFNITVSYVKLKNNRYSDVFNFEKREEFDAPTFILNENQDLSIKGTKEISMKAPSNFKELFKIMEKKLQSSNSGNRINSSKNHVSDFQSSTKQNKGTNEFVHEILTIRVYDTNKNFFSKFSILLYKAFSLGDQFTKSINNTKENSQLFNALIRNNYRDSKLTRILQDTASYNCFLINNLPAQPSNIVILHDILTLVKSRKSAMTVDCEELLKKDFEKLRISNSSTQEIEKINEIETSLFHSKPKQNVSGSESNEEMMFSFVAEKEHNIPFSSSSININSNYTKSDKGSNYNEESSLKIMADQNYNQQSAVTIKMEEPTIYRLNMNRLRKISNKDSLKMIFDSLENS